MNELTKTIEQHIKNKSNDRLALDNIISISNQFCYIGKYTSAIKFNERCCGTANCMYLLSYAAEQGHYEAFSRLLNELMLKHSKAEYQPLLDDALVVAASYNRIPIVTKLINEGANLNCTIAHVEQLQAPTAELAITNLTSGSTPSFPGTRSVIQTPLLAAIRKGHLELAQLFLTYNAHLTPEVEAYISAQTPVGKLLVAYTELGKSILSFQEQNTLDFITELSTAVRSNTAFICDYLFHHFQRALEGQATLPGHVLLPLTQQVFMLMRSTSHSFLLASSADTFFYRLNELFNHPAYANGNRLLSSAEATQNYLAGLSQNASNRLLVNQAPQPLAITYPSLESLSNSKSETPFAAEVQNQVTTLAPSTNYPVVPVVTPPSLPYAHPVLPYTHSQPVQTGVILQQVGLYRRVIAIRDENPRGCCSVTRHNCSVM